MFDKECIYYDRCLNNEKCYKCNENYLLLKLPEDKYKKRLKQKARMNSYNTAKKYKKETDKSWRGLEQTVSNKLNEIPTIEEARRSKRSGALEFEKGDIVDSILHPECKERTGKELKTGEKSMTIKKEWLTKAKEECKNTDKTMCLPFRFKNDEDIYVIIDFDDLASLVNTLKAYKLELEIVRNKQKNN